MELLMTAFVALLIYLLIAKLVSLLMATDGRHDSGTGKLSFGVVEDVKFERSRKVEGTKIKKKVRFASADDAVVCKVDKFNVQGQSSSVANSEERSCNGLGVIVAEEKSELLAEPPELGFVEEVVVGKVEYVASGIGGLFAEETYMDEVDCEKSVKLRSDDDVDDQRGQFRVSEVADDRGNEIEMEPDRVEKNGGQIGMALANGVILDHQSQSGKIMEIGEDQWCGIHSELNEGEESLIYDEDDDWEGIEKSELEKTFANAANYDKDDQLLKLGRDVQMQLYGLYKVSMEGPCHEAQPMALKVSARAKWNAWQKLGNMSPEVAMEQYIDLLSDSVPGWSQKDNSTKDGEVDSTEAAMPGVLDPHTTTLMDTSQKEKKVKLISCSDGGALAGHSNSANKDEN